MTPFAKFYGNLNQHMDEFVRIFPVHPDDIDTFERVTAVKKRQIPKTLTTSMEEIQNQALWENYPGFLAYDGYWKILTENTSFMTIKEVKKILDSLMQNPAFFPFSLPEITGSMALSVSPRIDLCRYGLDDELMMLK